VKERGAVRSTSSIWQLDVPNCLTSAERHVYRDESTLPTSMSEVLGRGAHHLRDLLDSAGEMLHARYTMMDVDAVRRAGLHIRHSN